MDRLKFKVFNFNSENNKFIIITIIIIIIIIYVIGYTAVFGLFAIPSLKKESKLKELILNKNITDIGLYVSSILLKKREGI